MAKELLFSITKKDFEIQYFSGTGAGGQHRNKHQNCVRLRHIESGAMATGQANRERLANLKDALQGLLQTPKFKFWHSAKIQEVITGSTIEQKIEAMMTPKNIKVEAKNSYGQWEEIDPLDIVD
jgi:peptide chain release factor 1